jgi:polyphosphate kinase 2 (PPK2 family)
MFESAQLIHDISKDEQYRRFREREKAPYKRFKKK